MAQNDEKDAKSPYSETFIIVCGSMGLVLLIIISFKFFFWMRHEFKKWRIDISKCHDAESLNTLQYNSANKTYKQYDDANSSLVTPVKTLSKTRRNETHTAEIHQLTSEIEFRTPLERSSESFIIENKSETIKQSASDETFIESDDSAQVFFEADTSESGQYSPKISENDETNHERTSKDSANDDNGYYDSSGEQYETESSSFKSGVISDSSISSINKAYIIITEKDYGLKEYKIDNELLQFWVEKNLILDRRYIDIRNDICSGNFGTVCMAYLNLDGNKKKVAVKKFKDGN